MNDISYRFRLSIAASEVTYELTDGALCWNNRASSLAFSQIRAVRTYDVPGLQQAGAPAFARCVIWPTKGRAIVINSNSFVSFGKTVFTGEQIAAFLLFHFDN